MSTNRGWASLGVLYLMWGTGCPAIKACLDGGFGPFGLGTFRLAAAAMMLTAVAVVFRRTFVWHELPRILWVGALFWIVSSGLQVWGQQGVTAGVAALVLGTTPLIGALLDRATLRTFASLGVCLLGLFVAAEGDFDPRAIVALMLAAAVGAWAASGSRTLESDLIWVAALQLGVGAVGQGIAMLVAGEALPVPSTVAWWAWSWLVVGPAILGMLAYLHASRHLRLTVVLTYAIVSPAVALFTGWALLGESVGARQIAGLLVVAGGLAPLFSPGLAVPLPRRFRRRLPRVA